VSVVSLTRDNIIRRMKLSLDGSLRVEGSVIFKLILLLDMKFLSRGCK
jgi:hypothetical protein